MCDPVYSTTTYCRAYAEWEGMRLPVQDADLLVAQAADLEPPLPPKRKPGRPSLHKRKEAAQVVDPENPGNKCGRCGHYGHKAPTCRMNV